jgi:hypothetical protein
MLRVLPLLHLTVYSCALLHYPFNIALFHPFLHQTLSKQVLLMNYCLSDTIISSDCGLRSLNILLATFAVLSVDIWKETMSRGHCQIQVILILLIQLCCFVYYGFHRGSLSGPLSLIEFLSWGTFIICVLSPYSGLRTQTLNVSLRFIGSTLVQDMSFQLGLCKLSREIRIIVNVLGVSRILQELFRFFQMYWVTIRHIISVKMFLHI